MPYNDNQSTLLEGMAVSYYGAPRQPLQNLNLLVDVGEEEGEDEFEEDSIIRWGQA